MTRSTTTDDLAHVGLKTTLQEVREADLAAPDTDEQLTWYDPKTDEPAGLSVDEYQEKDYEEMSTCDGLIAVWSQNAHQSAGMMEEIAWARRVFNIPVVLWKPNEVILSPWTKATAKHQVVEGTARDALRCLILAIDDS
jgi:hypothetical protein